MILTPLINIALYGNARHRYASIAPSVDVSSVYSSYALHVSDHRRPVRNRARRSYQQLIDPHRHTSSENIEHVGLALSHQSPQWRQLEIQDPSPAVTFITSPSRMFRHYHGRPKPPLIVSNWRRHGRWSDTVCWIVCLIDNDVMAQTTQAYGTYSRQRRC